MDNEIWVKIAEFADYEISNLGRVRDNLKGGRILKQSSQEGSAAVHLRSGMFYRSRRLAKLVWLSFVDPTVDYKVQFDFLNGDKFDCRLENLQKKNTSVKTPYELPTGFVDELKSLVHIIESHDFIIDSVTILTLVSLHVDIFGDRYDRYKPADQLMMMYADIKKYIKDFE
jgi:hypothetical protein